MLKSGLVNVTGVEWYFASWPRFGSVPGQSFLYEVPSKSESLAMQPPTGTSSDSAEVKQPPSSSSRLSSPLAVQLPPSPSTAEQYSKWPISSENATLYECAAHGTRVCSLEVEYIGRNVYGDWLHAAEVGSKFTCA